MIGIYKITSPTGKVYIGQSININKRFYQYKKLHCKGQVILYNSFMKHGVENHIFEVIKECEVLELNNEERDYNIVFNNEESETQEIIKEYEKMVSFISLQQLPSKVALSQIVEAWNLEPKTIEATTHRIVKKTR